MDKLFLNVSNNSLSFSSMAFSSTSELSQERPRSFPDMKNRSESDYDHLNNRPLFIDASAPNIVIQSLVVSLKKRLGIEINCCDVMSAIAWKAFGLSAHFAGHEVSRLRIIGLGAHLLSSRYSDNDNSQDFEALHTFDALRTATLASILLSMLGQQKKSRASEDFLGTEFGQLTAANSRLLNIYHAGQDDEITSDRDAANNILIFQKDLWSTSWRSFSSQHSNLEFRRFVEQIVFDGEE